MKLIDFAQGSEQDYQRLQRDIDALPRGRILLFDCEMPPEARPALAAVGFHRVASRYAVFIDRPVYYSGVNRAAAALCGGTHQTFLNFNELKRFLQTLPAAECDEEYDVSGIDVEGLLPPQQADTTVVDYRRVQQEIGKHILGQETAVETLAHQVTLYLNKCKPRKPLSIVAYGPPGTGKSEAAKALPKILSRLCPDNYATVWTELNTFTEAHSVYRLIGSPPSYIGYNDTPVFEAVVDNPRTVFIFDELDKAHPEVLKTFMSILDEGRCAARKELADHSREYDFRHCIFIFTSNFRLENTSRSRIGFACSDDVESIRHEDGAIDVSYRQESPADESDTVTKRIYRDTEAARRAFVEAGILKEIASRFNCFIEFRELSDEAKIRILAKQVVETGLEYNIRLAHIDPGILQPLIQASMSENALTVRSFKSVIEGYLSSAFAEAAVSLGGQAVRLSGTIEDPAIVPA